MRTELKPYPTYEPAESEWIGGVPTGWDVLPFKRLCKRVDVGIAEAATHAYAETGVPIVRGTNVRPHRIEGEILYIEPWFAEKNRSKYMRAGDLVTVRTGYPGVTAVIPPELDRSQCFTMIISTMKKAHVPEFFCYFFNSVCGMAHFAVEGWGSAQTNISVPTVQLIEVPHPPLPQQKAIVVFLDRETAKIDRLMEVRRRQVERLQEQRAAVTHHAVTKGLDPSAKTKASGIEWLPEVPAGWKINRLRFVVRFKGGGTPSKAKLAFWEGDIPWVSPKDMKTLDISDAEDHVTSEALEQSASSLVRKGSVLIVVRSGILRHSIPVAVNSVDVALNQDMKALQSSKLDSRFLMYYVLGNEQRLLLLWRKEGSTVESLEQPLIGGTRIAFPPKPEQTAIVAHIERETAKLDTLATKYRRELELLAEYRASLISHAVTGKIDVRGLVAPAQLEVAQTP